MLYHTELPEEEEVCIRIEVVTRDAWCGNEPGEVIKHHRLSKVHHGVEDDKVPGYIPFFVRVKYLERYLWERHTEVRYELHG